MRKYITLFFSVTFLLSACKGGKTPGEIINHDRMISLLTELHIVDGSVLSVPQFPDSLYKYGTGRYLVLFEKYHTDSVQFKKSLKYYTTKPVELQSIYDQVLVNLKQKTDSLNKLQQKQQYNAIPKK
jgi:hypothetical protein